MEIPKRAFAFLFLGKTLVVYHNPKCLDTFGHGRAAVKKITLTFLDKHRIEFKGDTVPGSYAEKIRDEFVPRIDIELG